MALHVAGLWRYPVKSLAGEPLSTAVIGPDGIPGDRVVRVRGPEGVRTSRRQYRLLGLRGTLDAEGPRINGYLWNSPDALALVKGAAGADAWLEAREGLDRFDILPLLVATDGAVAALISLMEVAHQSGQLSQLARQCGLNGTLHARRWRARPSVQPSSASSRERRRWPPAP